MSQNKKLRRRRKPKRLNSQQGSIDSTAAAKTSPETGVEVATPQPVLWDGEEDTLRYDNKGRPLRLKRPPKRLLEEMEGGADSATGAKKTKQEARLPAPTSTDTPSNFDDDASTPKLHGSQRQKKRANLVRKLSAPNEHGIVVEEAENAGSAPLSLSKRRRAPRKTCNDKKISKHVLELLGIPVANLPSSTKAGGKTSDKPTPITKRQKIETYPEPPSATTAEQCATACPFTPTEVAEATSKTDDLLPVRVSGIRSSVFTSVMRIVSGVCPLQPSPRLDRLCRPSVAPPVWAQVSKSGFG